MYTRDHLLPEDCVYLYNWRTDTETVRHSFKPKPTWDEHCLWFEKAMQDNISVLIALEDPVVPQGIIHVDDNDTINIMVAPRYRHTGVASFLIEEMKARRTKLVAKVLVGNTTGLKLFAKAGFKIVGTEETNGYVVMKWRKL